MLVVDVQAPDKRQSISIHYVDWAVNILIDGPYHAICISRYSHQTNKIQEWSAPDKRQSISIHYVDWAVNILIDGPYHAICISRYSHQTNKIQEWSGTHWFLYYLRFRSDEPWYHQPYHCIYKQFLRSGLVNTPSITTRDRAYNRQLKSQNFDQTLNSQQPPISLQLEDIYCRYSSSLLIVL